MYTSVSIAPECLLTDLAISEADNYNCLWSMRRTALSVSLLLLSYSLAFGHFISLVSPSCRSRDPQGFDALPLDFSFPAYPSPSLLNCVFSSLSSRTGSGIDFFPVFELRRST